MNRVTLLTLLLVCLANSPIWSTEDDQQTLQSRRTIRWKKHPVVESAKSSINSAQAFDVDGDGDLDVVASYERAVFILQAPEWRPIKIHRFIEGQARNRPTAACIHSCLLDCDGDGDLDFVGSNRTLFWLEQPNDQPLNSQWKYRTIDDEIAGTHCVLPGDVNGDGVLDLIANSFQDKSKTSVPNSILWFDGRRTSADAVWKRTIFANQDAPGGSHYMGIGDLNGDGRPDITAGAKGDPFPNGNWFAWWEQPANPDGTWTKHLLANQELGASNIEPANVDGDEHVDIVATRGHGQGICWFRGPKFEKQEVDVKIEGPHTLVTADLDGDQDTDIAVCGRGDSGTLAWFQNDGVGNFNRFDIDVGQGSYDLRAYDLDGDGDLDLLCAGHQTKNLVWYENCQE